MSQPRRSQPVPLRGDRGHTGDGRPYPCRQALPGKNADGSVDIYFRPKPPKGKEKFWLETIPGNGWFPVVRFYGPLAAYNNKTWKPGDIVLVK